MNSQNSFDLLFFLESSLSLKKKVLSLAFLLMFGSAPLSLCASSHLEEIKEDTPLLPSASASGSFSLIQKQASQQLNVIKNADDTEEEEELSEIIPANPSLQPLQAPTPQEEQKSKPQENTFASLLPSGSVITLKHVMVNPEVKPEDEIYLLQQIGLISSTLKLVEVSVLQKMTGAHEAAEVSSHTLEEPGDVRDGLFILLESIKRPHRYHARFYSFDQQKYALHRQSLRDQQGPSSSTNQVDEIYLTTNERTNRFLRKLFRTPVGLDLRLEGCLLTRSKPNKLFLSFEEEDTRCLGGVSDFFGTIYSKFEKDPLAAVSLIAGGASRIAKAVMTNGASELANLTQ